jgi:hypothetical protein
VSKGVKSEGSQSRWRVKYGQGSRGTQHQEPLCWRGPAGIQKSISASKKLRNACFYYSYRKRDIERLLRLTNSFTWEELPTRDPATGHTTNAGYIPKILSFARYYPALVLLIHFPQSIVRMVISREMMITKWYPFDSSLSPMYELVNLTQVNVNLHNNIGSTESVYRRNHYYQHHHRHYHPFQ